MAFSTPVRRNGRWDSPERSPAERLAGGWAQAGEELQRCAAMEQQLARESRQRLLAVHRVFGPNTPMAGARTPSFPRRSLSPTSRGGSGSGHNSPRSSGYNTPKVGPKGVPGSATPPHRPRASLGSTPKPSPGTPSCGMRRNTSARNLPCRPRSPVASTRSSSKEALWTRPASKEPLPRRSSSKEAPLRQSSSKDLRLKRTSPAIKSPLHSGASSLRTTLPAWPASRATSESKGTTRTSLPSFPSGMQRSRAHLHSPPVALSEIDEQGSMKSFITNAFDEWTRNRDSTSIQQISKGDSKESLLLDDCTIASSETESLSSRAKTELLGEDLFKAALVTVKLAENDTSTSPKSILDDIQCKSPEPSPGSASTGLPLDDEFSDPEEEAPAQCDGDISSELLDSAISMVVAPEQAMHPGRTCAGILLLHRVKEAFLQGGLESFGGTHDIRRLFLDSIPADNVEIASIDQVVQPALFKKFLQRVAESRASVEATFHGTRKEHLESILKHGLIPSLCATGSYGKGSYVATHAGMAHQYADPDIAGWRHMVVVLVVVGKQAVKGRTGVQTAVTAMDSLSNPTQYCFVDATRLYVSHLIKYRVTNSFGGTTIGGVFEDPFQRHLSLATIRSGQIANRLGIR